MEDNLNLPPELARENFASEEEWKQAVANFQAKQQQPSSAVQQVMARRNLASGSPDALLAEVDKNIQQQAVAGEDGAAPATSPQGERLPLGSIPGPVVSDQPETDKRRAMAREVLQKQREYTGAPAAPVTPPEKKAFPTPPEGQELVRAPKEEEAAPEAPIVEAPTTSQIQAMEAQIAKEEGTLGALPKAVFEDPKAAYDKAMGSASQQFKSDLNRAVAIYEGAKKDLAKREMLEGIINAIGLIVSGLYGQAQGIDMSGVKTAKTDWEKKFDRAHEELRTAMSLAEKNVESSEKEAVRQAGFAKDANARAKDIWEMGIQEQRLQLQNRRLEVENLKAAERLKQEEKKAKIQEAKAIADKNKEEQQKARERRALINKVNNARNQLGYAYGAKQGKDEKIDAAVGALQNLNEEYMTLTGAYLYDPKSLETRVEEGTFWDTIVRPTPDSIKKMEGAPAEVGGAGPESAPAPAAPEVKRPLPPGYTLRPGTSGKSKGRFGVFDDKGKPLGYLEDWNAGKI